MSTAEPASVLDPDALSGTSVEGFSIELPGFNGFLAAPEPSTEIEILLLDKLEAPIRLLRWAIVKVEGTRFLCEGAYLKRQI